MMFKKYDSYKESALEWLGEIPSEWGVKRLKDTFRYFGSGSTPLSTNMKYYDNGTIPWLNTTDIKNNIVNSTKYKITKLAFSELNMKIYPKNSLAIGMYGQGETRGSIALLDIKVTTNQNAGIMYKFLHSNSKFIFWWFIGRKAHIRQIGNIATIPNINKDIVRNLFIALPPLKTQTKIATYLDTQTQKIDKEIELLEQKSLKYKELKQTLINETVLRGLDKSVELKNSGIEWIGDIPKHWEVKRLKGLVSTVKGRNLETIENQKEDYLPNLSLEYLRKGKTFFTTYIKTFDKKLLVNDNDLIIIWDGAGVGEILKGKKGYLSSTIAKLNFNRNINQKYFYNFYYKLNYILKEIPAGMGIPHLNPIIFNSFMIPLPPLKEQQKIASYLDKKIQTIDNITQTISKKIKLLKEFRKTLINDVVTGKVKVCD